MIVIFADVRQNAKQWQFNAKINNLLAHKMFFFSVVVTAVVTVAAIVVVIVVQFSVYGGDFLLTKTNNIEIKFN